MRSIEHLFRKKRQYHRILYTNYNRKGEKYKMEYDTLYKDLGMESTDMLIWLLINMLINITNAQLISICNIMHEYQTIKYYSYYKYINCNRLICINNLSFKASYEPFQKIYHFSGDIYSAYKIYS